jgi:hypothetical protein
MKSLGTAVGLALWSAVAMTFGDWVWAALSLTHRPQYGLVHGTLLCFWMGLYLGALSGRVAWGALVGAAIGFAAAASFYGLAPMLGYSAMFASWVGLWFGLAWLTRQLLASRGLSGGHGILRAVLAAVGSGVAFYAVSGIWMRPPSAYEYAWHFAAWTIAFLPGSLALLFDRGKAIE